MPWNNFTAKLFADNNLGPVLEGQVDLARLCAESDELHADHADVYLQRLYRCELKIADHLQALLRKEGPLESDDEMEVNGAFDEFELDATQRRAVRTALCNRFSVICGGPGTGKTQVIRAILQSLRTEGAYVLATTHKAAQHLKKVCQCEATTFHSIVCKSESGTFQSHCTNFIVDEISMMDVEWASRFFDQFAWRATRIVFIGDHFQLPPVGPGAIARDLHGHPSIPQVELKKCYRTDSATIAYNLSLLRKRSLDTFKEEESFELLQYGNGTPETCLKKAVAKRNHAYSPVTPGGIKILCQTNDHVNLANRIAQKRFNPDGESSPFEYWKTVAENAKKPKHFRVGDRVKSNQADGDILRDEEGTIVRWLWKDNEGRSGALVRFDSGSLELMERPGDIDLAYATTIHKGQGGEFLNVLVVLCNIPVSQSSESVYTGISRAKQWCALLYPNEKILKLARTRRLERWTKLRAYLNKRSVD